MQYSRSFTAQVTHGHLRYSWSEMFNICRDLDQASMEAVAALLAGLPLQPEESDRGDLMEAKSQLFLKYQTLHLFHVLYTSK